MQKSKLSVVAIAILAVMLIGCTKVPAGYRGVKVYLLGKSKGVDTEVLGIGRYYIGVNEDLFLFPVFMQNVHWTESITPALVEYEKIQVQKIMAGRWNGVQSLVNGGNAWVSLDSETVQMYQQSAKHKK